MYGILSIGYNVFGLGEVAEHKTSIVVTILNLKQMSNKKTKAPNDAKPVLVAVIKTCKCCGHKNAPNFTYCYECGHYL